MALGIRLVVLPRSRTYLSGIINNLPDGAGVWPKHASPACSPLTDGEEHMQIRTQRPQPISIEELESLRAVKRGVDATKISPAHRAAFVERGWVEEKFGGIVLTGLGRYQLELRIPEPGLMLIANRWQQRAKGLRELAASMTNGNTEGLCNLASRWDALAAELLDLEQLEKADPMLGDGTHSPRGARPVRRPRSSSSSLDA